MKRLFEREYRHFWSLNKQGRMFFLSVFLFDLLVPIYAIFINAFLWRQSQDINLILIYNVTIFSLIPFGFYLNGLLLKHFSVKVLYFKGALFKAISLAVLLILPFVNLPIVLLFGVCYGLSLGLFWSNRNLLHLELTKSSNRLYFSSLDFLSRTVSQILIPAFIGYILVFGTTNNLYTTQQGYYAVGIATLVLTLLFGTVIKKIHAPANPVSRITLHTKTAKWNHARGILWLIGLFEGTYLFLPVLIILTLIGKEDILGLIQSGAAVLTGGIIYAIARSINTKYRLRVIQLSVFCMIIGGLALSISYTPVGVFMFIAIISVALTLLITECQTLIFDLIDKESNGAPDNRYPYVFDFEVNLNAGRVMSILLFFAYIHMFSLDFAIRFSPLIFAIALVVLMFFAKALILQDPDTVPDEAMTPAPVPDLATQTDEK